MAKELTERPNLRNLKNQAKTILKAHGRGDSAACAIARLLRRFTGASNDDILAANLSLTNVQYALSLEYGFRSWNELRERILAAENENLSARATALVRKAREHFATKGPARDATGSGWDRELFHLTSEFQAAGEDGYLADLELSRSENARARKQAAIGFGIRRDARSKEQLVRLLNDRSYVVRRTAIFWYAGLIHPDQPRDPIVGAGAPASHIPQGLAMIFPMVEDRNDAVRMAAVNALTSYGHLGDPDVTEALTQAMNDRKHKVRHAAAKALGVVCPGCGAQPTPL